MAPSIATYILLQTQTYSLIANFANNTNKTGIEKRTQGFLSGRINLLNQYFDKFAANHYDMIAIATKDDLKQEYFANDTYVEVERLFTEALGTLTDQLTAFTPVKTTTEKPSQPPAAQTVITRISIPTNIPKFSGSILEWPSFKDLFSSVVINNDELTNVQKLQHLKLNISGEAAELLRDVLITDANYDSSWQSLIDHYENERIVVNTHLNRLLNIPPMTKESCSELKSILLTTTQSIRALKNLGRPTKHWDDWLVFITVQKLDHMSRKDWEKAVSGSKDLCTFTELEDFLESRVRTLEVLDSLKVHHNSKVSHTQQNSTSNSSNQNRNSVKANHTTPGNKCPLCGAKHGIGFCSAFRRKSIIQRREFLLKENLCFNCLGRNHQVSECPSSHNCRRCQSRHHTMVHLDSEADQESHKSNSQSFQAQQATTTISSNLVNSVPHIKRVLLATAILNVKARNGTLIKLRALLDQGSQATFITEAAVQLLNLKKQRICVPILGIASTSAGSSKSRVQLSFMSATQPTQCFSIDALVLPKLSNLLPDSSFGPSQWSHLMDLQLADPQFHLSSKIDIILGADIYGSLLIEGLRTGPIGSPIGQNTVLGWIVSGGVHTDTPKTSIAIFNINVDYQAIDHQLKRFWEVEEVDTAHTMNEDDLLCEEYFKQTHRRNPDGRYVVRLPFSSRENLMNDFGNSRPHAVARLFQVEKMLDKDINLKTSYHNFMREYAELGHMRPVTCQSSVNFYIPHHCVQKTDSSSTKLRVVFDASRKSSSGFSLNDKLLTGQKLQRDLPSIILRWRMHRYVFISDIEKMFRQISVHEDDIDLQRIVWRNSSNDPPLDYNLLTVTYGTASAPYLAIRVLHQLASDEATNFPNAAEVLVRDCYVDDILSGAESLETCQSLQNELINLLKSGGFTLKKWSSNHPQLLSHLPHDYIENCNFQISDDEALKALGVYWSPQTDLFAFKIQLDTITSDPTKRDLLSDIARLFDPLGWLGPVIIRGKIMLQQLWLTGLGWDDPLPESLAEKWLQFRSQLINLEAIKIPRWIMLSDSVKGVEVYGFSDASICAYAAVVYVRIIQADNSIHSNILTSKTKVAPIKQLSLPRLELCGAVLLTRLINKVLPALDISNVSTCAFTDSSIVLAWLKGHASRWKTFVANRVSKIQSNLHSIQWRHIQSLQNPADCASRGITPFDLKNHNLWWHGPIWLRQNKSLWPASTDFAKCETNVEEKVIANISTTINCNIIERFSSLNRLVRSVAYLFRFINNAKSQINERYFGPLTTTELKSARIACVKFVQGLSYQAEINDLRLRKSVQRKSKIISLNPFLDKNGVLRVSGRLVHSNLGFDEKHPIVLPKVNKFTDLVINAAHIEMMHGGAQLTLNHIRRKYWIVDGRNKVRLFIGRCVTCYRNAPKISSQLMGDLPGTRVNPSRPFMHTGVDYAGPIVLRMYKGRCNKTYKAYIAVFICFATKAVHLELVTEQSSQAFITAFLRFTARRGICSDLYSDQGTNFVGAKTILRNNLFIATRQQANEIALSLSQHGTQWHFNPPGAPHHGGLWEAAVKSTKYHLKRCIGQTTLTYEEMSTLLCQVEACLNSRPLCRLTNDPDDVDVLTPGHFLIGGPLRSVPEPNLLEKNVNRLQRYQLVQHMYQSYWRRWSSEYLNVLQQRVKWRTEQPNIKIDDIVLLRDDRYPPAQWPLGRIIKVFPDAKGHVRVVSVKTRDSIFNRPITKVCSLPFNGPTQNLSDSRKCS